MTEETKVPDKVEPAWMELARNVSCNASQIRWPQNALGVAQVSSLRKAIADAANSMRGNTEKEDLVIATLLVGLAHVKARRDKDKLTKTARLSAGNAMAAERISRDGWHPLTTKETANG